MWSYIQAMQAGDPVSIPHHDQMSYIHSPVPYILSSVWACLRKVIYSGVNVLYIIAASLMHNLITLVDTHPSACSLNNIWTWRSHLNEVLLKWLKYSLKNEMLCIQSKPGIIQQTINFKIWKESWDTCWDWKYCTAENAGDKNGTAI